MWASVLALAGCATEYRTADLTLVSTRNFPDPVQIQYRDVQATRCGGFPGNTAPIALLQGAPPNLEDVFDDLLRKRAGATVLTNVVIYRRIEYTIFGPYKECFTARGDVGMLGEPEPDPDPKSATPKDLFPRR